MKKCFVIILSFYFLLSSFYLHSQVPQKFNYQGIARDSKGNPMAKQQLALKLSVLPTADAIAPEYEEVQYVLTNEFGLYTLQIGNGTAITGEMKTVKWETGNKYIKVMIDPKGGSDFVDAGTTQLLSVPYAIYADKAGMAKNTSSERTGTVSSNATHVAGDSNFLTKFTGLNVIGKSRIFDNGTNIGIGTTSPLARVHLTSNVGTPLEHIRMENTNTLGAGRFTMYNNDVNAFATFTKYGTTATGGSPGISALYPFANLLAFGNNQTGASGNGRFLISTEGNTGISLLKDGNAKLKLHIDYATERVGIGGNAVPASQVHFNNTAGSQDTIKFTNNTMGHTATDGLEIRTNGNNGRLINRENAFLLLGTNNTDRIAITGAGNVGIGTITPATALDVNGQVRIQGGTPGTGKVLTSDSSGLATWQKPSISTVENGLSKKNDTISLSGRLNKSTIINQDGNTFSILNLDTSGSAAVSISQLVFTPFTALTATPVTQTFKSLASSKLHSIDLRVTALSNTSITLVLKNAQGTTLATQTNNFAALFDSLSTFSIASQPILLPNETYTISVTGTAGTNWYFTNTNPYADGVASTGASNDFTFQIRTRVELPVLTAKNERIGIGTFDPTAKLDVNGDIRIQGGNPGLGKILMSDANGLASWQALGGPDSQWAKNGNNIFNNNSGNVGIGTNNPTKKLDVNGDALINGLTIGRGGGNDTLNTVLGFKAFGSNSLTGDENTAVGSRALFSNFTGSSNTAVGSSALRNNTEGFSNTAVGRSALSSNTTGSSNTAYGASALSSNTTGSSNTAYGASALFSNTTGSSNTANGLAALRDNTAGFENTGNGVAALLENTTGSLNTASGRSALRKNTTGSHNVGLGDSAGFSKTVYENCTFVGTHADASVDSLTNATAIGANAIVGASNSMVLGNNVKVGIGTSTPLAKLDVNGDALINGLTIGRGGGNDTLNTAIGFKAMGGNTSSGNNNTAVGSRALFSNTTGNDNTANGRLALRDNTTGNDNTANGFAALIKNTTGSQNTANGVSVLRDNTTGSNNTANGYFALQFNTTGNDNTANGQEALQQNTTGGGNTANGRNALEDNTTGTKNTAIGFSALRNNETGSHNVGIGDSAGHIGGIINSFESCTFLGSKADASSIVLSLSNATAIGANAKVGASNSMVLGNNVNIGIGTSVPTARLQIVSSDNTQFSNAILVKNNSSDTLLSLTNNGDTKVLNEVQRPSKTGASNLLPICYGGVNAGGTIQGSNNTGNYSAVKTATGTYEITITGETYNFGTHTTLVNALSASPRMVTTLASAGKLQIRVFDQTGTLLDDDFHFVVFKN